MPSDLNRIQQCALAFKAGAAILRLLLLLATGIVNFSSNALMTTKENAGDGWMDGWTDRTGTTRETAGNELAFGMIVDSVDGYYLLSH